MSLVYWVGQGEANDLAITPDGTKAVVASSRFIRAFDLGVSPPATPFLVREIIVPPAVVEDNSPRWRVTFPGIDFPDVTANSVLVTDDRAIVQYGAREICAWARPFVCIVDLTASGTAPEFVLSPDTTLCSALAPDTQKSPHDLAMNSNGLCVTGALNSLALFDLPAMSSVQTLIGNNGRAGGTYYAPRYPTPSPLPSEQLGPIVDSVVMSNSRAVAIRDNDPSSGVRVYDVSGGTLVRLSPGRAVLPGARVHDVAMSPDGLKAIVSADGQNFVMSNLGTYPTGNAPSTLHPTATPRGSPEPGSFDQVHKVFVSDSVLATNYHAAAISTEKVGAFQGYVDVFGLTPALGGGLVCSKTLSLSGPTDRVADLTLSPAGGYLFVRSTDSATPVASGNDFVGYVLSNGASMGTFGLPGDCVGVDVVEATTSRVVTISFDPITFLGYVDIFKF